jgi:hypothetical protein
MREQRLVDARSKQLKALRRHSAASIVIRA